MFIHFSRFTFDVAWFGGGAQNEFGNVAVEGDRFAMHQLRQMKVCKLFSDYYYYNIISY